MIGRRLFFGGGVHVGPMESRRTLPDLAEGCRRVALASFSIQMSNRYWRMAEGYRTLADGGGARHTTLGRLTASIAPNGRRLRWCVYQTNNAAKTVLQTHPVGVGPAVRGQSW